MTNQSASILRMALLLLLLLVYSTDAKLEIITSKSDVLVGTEVILLCKAGAEGEITWQKEGEDVEEENVFTVDETSSKFIIKSATIEDTGKYTCRCEYDTKSEETSMQLFVYEGPSFGSTTTYHEFLEGTVGKVPCLVSGRPGVDVQWLRNKEKIPSNEGERVHQLSDNTLIIENVKKDDAGTYICQAHIRERPLIFRELSVSVVINAPPSVHMKEDVKIVMAGQDRNTSLLCLADGLPKPNITWNMPVDFDPSRHQFNSDRSQLTIRSVVRGDYGEYVCTATNKIAESSASIMFQVFESPDVSVSTEEQNVSLSERVSVSCNVSGHPQPELHWLNPIGQEVNTASGRVHVMDDVLVIEEVMPSDGGLYSCMAVSPHGNASRKVAILTQPGPPHYLSVSPGPTSVLFSLKIPPISGGTTITSYVLQWKQSPEEQWKEIIVPASDALAVNSLKPYTEYTVRLAALNAQGRGEFSNTNNVRTLGMRGEPDSPVLVTDKMKIEGNSFSVPLKQIDDGGNPLLKFHIRYRPIRDGDKEGAEWKEEELSPDAEPVFLKDLLFGSLYQLEVTSVNANGSSIPTKFNFNIAEQQGGRMTKGSVVGIVMVIFLIVFLAVDATCCYRNRCGLLMFIAVKLFGQKFPGLKGVEDGEGTTNGEVKLNGLSTPRGSVQQAGVQTKEGGQLTEVTCDKAPLTKHEKTQPGRDLPTADA